MRMNAIKNKGASPLRRRKLPPLMNLDYTKYTQLNKSEFLILSRLAVLTANGTKTCCYTNEQALKEFGWAERQKPQRAIANLKKLNLIEVTRGYNPNGLRGPMVRIISLTAAPVIFSKKELKND